MRTLLSCLAWATLLACNDSNAPNAGTDNQAQKADTSIATDSRRNAPGTRDYTTDTGNKTQQGAKTGAPLPQHPSGSH